MHQNYSNPLVLREKSIGLKLIPESQILQSDPKVLVTSIFLLNKRTLQKTY